MSIIGDIWGAVTGTFADVAGGAVDGVLSAITTWIIAGVLALIELMWGVIDTSTQPQPLAEWFSGDATSPVQLAGGLGVVTLSITFLLAIIRGVLSGSPGSVGRVVGKDLPAAVLAIVCTVGFTKVGLDVADSMSAWVWAGTRDDAIKAMETLSNVLMTGLPGSQFLGVVAALGLLLAMAFMWIVLVVRESLIYLVIVFSIAFAWPTMVFPPLRDTAKKSLELLAALIIAKPVMTLAMSVGVSALGGIGATGEPGAPAHVNLAQEMGTLFVGVVTFGLAAFMPFLLWKLMPLVAAAVVAQGIASAPMRAAQTAMQMQYYGSTTMARLASGGKSAAAGIAPSSSTPPTARTSPPPHSRPTTRRLAG